MRKKAIVTSHYLPYPLQREIKYHNRLLFIYVLNITICQPSLITWKYGSVVHASSDLCYALFGNEWVTSEGKMIEKAKGIKQKFKSRTTL